MPRCAPPTAGGERAGRRGASGHLCARTHPAPLPPIGSGARPHRLREDGVGSVAPRERRTLRRGGGLGRELGGWGSARARRLPGLALGHSFSRCAIFVFPVFTIPARGGNCDKCGSPCRCYQKETKINSCLIREAHCTSRWSCTQMSQGLFLIKIKNST